MSSRNLRINIALSSGENQSLQIEQTQVPDLSNYSLNEIIEGRALTESLQGRSFRITGAQGRTGVPHCIFIQNRVKRALLSANGRYIRRRQRGLRIRRLLLPSRLSGELTNLNLVETR